MCVYSVCGEARQLVSQNDFSLHSLLRDGGQSDHTPTGAISLHGQRQRWGQREIMLWELFRLVVFVYQYFSLLSRVCTCGSELQTLVFGHSGFVVWVHKAVDVSAAATTYWDRLSHQHATNGDAVHLRHRDKQSHRIFDFIKPQTVILSSRSTI